MSGEDYRLHNKLIVNGAKLTEARLACGKSLSDVAVYLNDGCPKSTVCRWEMEILVPSEDRLQKLVTLLGTISFVVPNPQHGKAKHRRTEKKVEAPE